jgi:LPXTG-motif cell wall-anchored protein
MRVQQRVGIAAAVFGAAMVMSALVAGNAGAVASNPVEVPGNATTCEGVGFPSSLQLDGSITSGTGGNSLISYTVTDNKYVTLTSVDPSVTIQVVVVKGGDNYNKYSPYLTPMQSPLNGGGNVPNLSHWFVCYTVTPVVTTTAAEVTTTTAAEVTTTTAAEVTTTTAAEVTTTTVAEVTTTTLVDSEGPTTTTTDPQATTTTLVDNEGPTTTAQSSGGGSLPQTGARADLMLLLGLALVVGGVVVTALNRRADAN